MINRVFYFKKPYKINPDSIKSQTTNQAPAGKFDVIIAGAGPAGSTAAYFMAQQGLKVLLLERGCYPGAKVCGGVSIIAEHTHKLFPNFWDELEWERMVTDQSFWWMTEDSVLSTRYQSKRLAAAPYNRFAIKRIHLYQWLAQKAIDAGAILLNNHHVSEVLFKDNQAIGVKIAEPHPNFYLADIIVLADGANSMLAEKSGLIHRVSPLNMSLYVKETISLSAEIIEERFNLLPNEGAIIGLYGYPTAGMNGTASIHTFKDSISLNVGMSVADFAQSGTRPYELLNRLKEHPNIKHLLKDGKLKEYGSALIPEGGYTSIPSLVHPGIMITGDAAALVNGVHGVNLAMWSGFFAAKAATAAKIARDFSERKLSLYRTLLNESFVMQDMKANAGVAKMQQDIPYLFDLYTRMANEAAFHVAKVYTMPKLAKRKFIFQKLISMQPLGKMLKDSWRVLKVIK